MATDAKCQIKPSPQLVRPLNSRDSETERGRGRAMPNRALKTGSVCDSTDNVTRTRGHRQAVKPQTSVSVSVSFSTRPGSEETQRRAHENEIPKCAQISKKLQRNAATKMTTMATKRCVPRLDQAAQEKQL